MKQKLAIACGLLHSPRVVFFDEPLTGLDPAGIRRMKDTMRRLAREGAAVILSSHLLSLLEEVCTHVLILKQGEKIADGSLAEVRRRFAQQPDASLEDVFFTATGDDRVPRCWIIHDRALVYLQAVMIKNAVALRVRRLRQPRYLIGPLSASRISTVFFRQLRRRGPVVRMSRPNRRRWGFSSAFLSPP